MDASVGMWRHANVQNASFTICVNLLARRQYALEPEELLVIFRLQEL